MRLRPAFALAELVGRATAVAPGTCGELVQGVVNGVHFLVTCPVNLYARVTVALYRGARGVFAPDDCPKARQAVGEALAYCGRDDLGVLLTVHSAIPRGKGMGSSTADVAAAIAATAAALGRALSPAEVARLALAVEPSDGVMFPGIALFDHRQGRLAEELGPPPPIDIVALDCGGTIDTLEFNRIDRREALRGRESAFREALRLVRAGVAAGDPSLIGAGATLSARLHQDVLPKTQLDDVIAFAESVGAVGVNTAHSGTVIGILLDGRGSTDSRAAAVLAAARRAFPDVATTYRLKLVGGGLRIEDRA